jgi:hypothetical protein
MGDMDLIVGEFSTTGEDTSIKTVIGFVHGQESCLGMGNG